MAAQAAMKLPDVRYSMTRLGGGVTPAGVAFPGGLDLTTPSLALQPGALRDCLNFECSQSGGYGRIGGYERVDGRAAPSNASYQIVQFASFTTLPTVGQTVVQSSTDATGTIIAVNNVAGAYYVVLTQVVGGFNSSSDVYLNSGVFTVTAANPQTITAANPLTVSAALIGTAIPVTATITAQQDAQYLALAADEYRDLIQPVPGSGPVTPVGMDFGGADYLYAFRADEDGAQMLLYMATTSGWALIPFFDSVDFTAGTAEIQDGETLIQGGSTATIKRVMLRSGTYAGGTAAGGIVISDITGPGFSAGIATSSGGGSVTLSAAPLAITMQPGGKFEFTKCNFTGSADTRRVYGCDGVNKAFEFDGETLAPITTGLSPDAPVHITFHKNFLFLAQAASLIYSAPGLPFDYTALSGAGEIATGDVVTGIISLPGGQSTPALAVYQRSNTSILYGSDTDTFNLVSFNTGLGALPYSVQNMFDTFALDDYGVATLRTTLSYGNFDPVVLTKNIMPFLNQERNKISASSTVQDKSQYRLFFSDGFGLYVTMVNKQYMGSAPVFFTNPVYSCDTVDLVAGGMTNYFGSSDNLGYVYQLDKGTSFDGANIDAHFNLAWDPIKTPRILKRFRAASMEIQGGSYAEIQFGYQLGYGNQNINQPSNQNYQSNFSISQWDAFIWDNFIWDGQTLIPTDVDMTGTGENIQVIVSTSSNYIAPFNVNSIIYHYSMRRGLRV